MNWLNPIEWGNLAVEVAKSKLYEMFCQLFEGVVVSSYWICVIGGMVGIVLYVFGYKKGKNYPLISVAVYLIINILGRVLLSV